MDAMGYLPENLPLCLGIFGTTGDPAAMEQIRRLAETLGGIPPGPGESASAAPPPPADGRLTELLGRVMGAFSAPSEAAKLVAALKPLLTPERAERLEKALRAARMVQAARTVLPELTLGGEGR